MGPLEVFVTFFKATALSYGGFGSLPILRQDLVLSGLLTDAQLIQALAADRLSTGPGATYGAGLGYFLAGLPGAFAALVAICIPPLVMIPLVAVARRRLLTSAFIGFFRGASLATAGFFLALSIAFLAPRGLATVSWWQIPVAAATAIATFRGGVHPALLVGGGALAGVLLGS